MVRLSLKLSLASEAFRTDAEIMTRTIRNSFLMLTL